MPDKNLVVGPSVQASAIPFGVKLSPITGRQLFWVSTNDAFETVNPSTGLVAGISAGVVTVLARIGIGERFKTFGVTALPDIAGQVPRSVAESLSGGSPPD